MPAPPTVTAHVEKYLHGVRVDSFLIKHLRSYTAWRIHRMVVAGQVRIDGDVARPEQRVFADQEVAIRLIEPPDLVIPPEDVPLEVIYEDEWLLVVNKPAGLIAHPTGEIPDGTLINAVQHHLDRQSSHRGLLKPGVVHRLDMDTSGAIALCKEHLSHRLLSIQFQRERISKTYLALVEGVLTDDEIVVKLPIGRAAGCHSALMSARADALEAQPCQTSFKVLERMPAHTLVEARPRSGRMHQIRVHLATIGHPICGDECYGPLGVIRPARPKDPVELAARPAVSPLIGRQALHASKLAFAHPIHLNWMEFDAPLPTDMAAAIEAARGVAVGDSQDERGA